MRLEFMRSCGVREFLVLFILIKPPRKRQNGRRQASKLYLRTNAEIAGRYGEESVRVKADSWKSTSQLTRLDCLRAIQEIEASAPAVMQRLGPLVPVVIAEMRESMPANLWRIFEGYDISELEFLHFWLMRRLSNDSFDWTV